MKISAIDAYALILPINEIYGGAAGYLEGCRTLIISVETDNDIEGWGEATQGSACTPILSAAEMHLHVASKNAQPGGEMTGFLRLGKQAIFSKIDVKLATVTLTNTAGHGITVNRENLAELATRDP
jgi:L-alanine-DL-glutamate epimerase-like enolase superfamily enzyme